MDINLTVYTDLFSMGEIVSVIEDRIFTCLNYIDKTIKVPKGAYKVDHITNFDGYDMVRLVSITKV